MTTTVTVLMIAEDGGTICAHLRVDAPELDALAIIETRFTAPEDTELEDWKRIVSERVLIVLGWAPYTAV